MSYHPAYPSSADLRDLASARQFRIFRNHYLCDDCPNEWSDEMMVVGLSYCPCCDREAEPYDTETLLDEVIEKED
jgi:hypothetical protein